MDEELNEKMRELITKLSKKGWRVEFSNDGHYRVINGDRLIITREGCPLLGISDECVVKDLEKILNNFC